MAKTMLTIYKERLRSSKNLSDNHWQRAIDNYKHYFGRLDAGEVSEDAYPFYSKMSTSISYEVVETVLPRLIGRDPEFVFVGESADNVKDEELAKAVVESQYNNPKLELMGEPIYLKLQKMAKEALITGNAVGRPMWRRKTKRIAKYMASLDRAGFKDEKDILKVIEAAEKLGKEDEVKYGKDFAEMPFLDDFDLTHLPFYHYFPDAQMIEPGRFRFHIERELVTFDDLSDEAKRYEYNETMMAEIKEKWDKGKGGFTPRQDSATTKDFMFEYNELFASENVDAHSTDDESIPLLRVDKMWEPSSGKVFVFVNEKWNLTGEKGVDNPYDVQVPPFIHVHDVVVPHSYYSRGEIDSIKKLEDGANDLMNMRFDNLLQAMLNYWLYNPKMMADGDEFVPIPNTTTAVKDVEKAVRIISGQDVTASSYKEADNLTAMIKNIAGISDYTQGQEGDTLAGRTYGGMRLRQEVANARFVIKSRTFEKVTLKALGYFMLEFSKQFISKDRLTRVIGNDGQVKDGKISAGRLKAIPGFMDLRVIPNSSMLLDQQAEAVKLNAVADRFATNKGAFQDVPNEVYDKFFLKYLQAYGITDAEYWVRARQDARDKGNGEPKEEEKLPPQAPPGGIPGMPPGMPLVPGMPPIPGMAPGGAPVAVPPIPAAPALPLTAEQTMVNNVPTGTQDVIQGDQIASQPNPLEQLINSGALS